MSFKPLDRNLSNLLLLNQIVALVRPRRRYSKEKAALLVVIGVNSQGEKRYLAMEAGYRESKESWAGVLRQLKTRGMKNPRLFIGDGNLGLWAAVSEVFPQAQEQLCWNHKALNVMDCVSKKKPVAVKSHMNAMMYAESQQEALKERKNSSRPLRTTPRRSRRWWRTGPS